MLLLVDLVVDRGLEGLQAFEDHFLIDDSVDDVLTMDHILIFAEFRFLQFDHDFRI